jgi:hypothetical protein
MRPVPSGFYLANQYPTPQELVLFDNIKQPRKNFYMCIGATEMGN